MDLSRNSKKIGSQAEQLDVKGNFSVVIGNAFTYNIRIGESQFGKNKNNDFMEIDPNLIDSLQRRRHIFPILAALAEKNYFKIKNVPDEMIYADTSAQKEALRIILKKLLTRRAGPIQIEELDSGDAKDLDFVAKDTATSPNNFQDTKSHDKKGHMRSKNGSCHQAPSFYPQIKTENQASCSSTSSFSSKNNVFSCHGYCDCDQKEECRRPRFLPSTDTTVFELKTIDVELLDLVHTLTRCKDTIKVMELKCVHIEAYEGDPKPEHVLTAPHLERYLIDLAVLPGKVDDETEAFVQKILFLTKIIDSNDPPPLTLPTDKEPVKTDRNHDRHDHHSQSATGSSSSPRVPLMVQRLWRFNVGIDLYLKGRTKLKASPLDGTLAVADYKFFNPNMVLKMVEIRQNLKYFACDGIPFSLQNVPETIEILHLRNLNMRKLKIPKDYRNSRYFLYLAKLFPNLKILVIDFAYSYTLHLKHLEVFSQLECLYVRSAQVKGDKNVRLSSRLQFVGFYHCGFPNVMGQGFIKRKHIRRKVAFLKRIGFGGEWENVRNSVSVQGTAFPISGVPMSTVTSSAGLEGGHQFSFLFSHPKDKVKVTTMNPMRTTRELRKLRIR